MALAVPRKRRVLAKLLLIFGGRSTFFGIPSLFAYLFIAWLILIALVRILAERARPRNRGPGPGVLPPEQP